MKRIGNLAVIMAVLLLSLPLFATTSDIRCAPYGGAFNIDMASERYTARTNYTGTRPWGGWLYDNQWVNGIGAYTSDMMIALLGTYYVPAGETENATMTVTISCPDGFNFVSQSNPTFRRPFRILVVPKVHSGGTANEMLGTKTILEQTTSSFTFDFKDVYDIASGSKVTFDPTINRTNNTIKCDIVLVLPYGDSSTFLSENPDESAIDRDRDVITIDGESYPLIVANDYTALVTFIIDYEATNEDTGEIVRLNENFTIPFSGYYEKENQTVVKSTANMYAAPSSSASRIDLLSSMGNPVKVGSINMWMDSSDSSLVPRIFVSSSRDPNATYLNEFTLVHSSVDANTLLTSRNSINYKVRLEATGGTYDSASQLLEFSGDQNIDSFRESDSGWVVLTETPEYDIPPWGSTTALSYYSYSGDIYVIVEDRSTVMYSGRYSSNIYIHMVAAEGATQ